MNRLTALSLTFSAASALTIIGASTADAHTGRLTATTACADGGWVATFTATNIDPTHSMTPSTPGFVPTPIVVGGQGSLVQAFPASQTSVSLTGYFVFDNNFTDPYSLTVTAPTGCVTTTTVPVTSTTVATSTTQPTVASTTVATTTSQVSTTVGISSTTTTHPEYVTDDPQTLPATGVSTVGLLLSSVGLLCSGTSLVMIARHWTKERS